MVITGVLGAVCSLGGENERLLWISDSVSSQGLVSSYIKLIVKSKLAWTQIYAVLVGGHGAVFKAV